MKRWHDLCHSGASSLVFSNNIDELAWPEKAQYFVLQRSPADLESINVLESLANEAT